jgi:hypothetical protein
MSVTGINGSGCCGGGVCVVDVVDVVVVGIVSETRRFSQFTVAFIDWTNGGWERGAAHREKDCEVREKERRMGAVYSFWVVSGSVHLQISHVTFKR